MGKIDSLEGLSVTIKSIPHIKKLKIKTIRFNFYSMGGKV